MEPLRGGGLCKLEAAREAQLQALRPSESIPAWGFRFLQGLPNVTMILSGMSSLQQVQENITTFQTSAPLSAQEAQVLAHISSEMIAEAAVPCTACRYCTDGCPQQLDIPRLLALYNERADRVDTDKGPDSCIGCRKCEQLCPQGIKISELMKKHTALLK